MLETGLKKEEYHWTTQVAKMTQITINDKYDGLKWGLKYKYLSTINTKWIIV